MHEWWRADPGEHYWIEVTDRDDVGADLNAPATKDDGKPFWSYDLLTCVADGDVVFHFFKPFHAIVAYSYASGDWWEDQVVWAARGMSARDAGVRPYPRPGRRRGLHHLTPVEPWIRLPEMRAAATEIIAVRDGIAARHGRPTYFPFGPYGGEGLRPIQGYLFKLPKDLLPVLGLDHIARLGAAQVAPSSAKVTPSRSGAAAGFGGVPYRRASVATAVSYADPMPRDPALMERALAAHAETQNWLADELQALGLTPLSPGPGDPDWDLAYWEDSTLVVVEVKSLSGSNEERQLRLGLGQVLRYRSVLSSRFPQVRAVLVTERAPSDGSWIDVCASVEVGLHWSGGAPVTTRPRDRSSEVNTGGLPP